MKLGRSHAGWSKPEADSLGEKIDEGRVIVRTGDLLERLAAGFEEGVTSLLLKLFERLQAVGREGRGHHKQFFHPGLWQANELVISIRRQPRFALQAGLERDGIFCWGNPQACYKRPSRSKALRAVARGMGRRGPRAAVRNGEAMSPRRIRFSQVAFREPVVGEQDVVVRVA